MGPTASLVIVSSGSSRSSAGPPTCTFPEYVMPASCPTGVPSVPPPWEADVVRDRRPARPAAAAGPPRGGGRGQGAGRPAGPGLRRDQPDRGPRRAASRHGDLPAARHRDERRGSHRELTSARGEETVGPRRYRRADLPLPSAGERNAPWQTASSCVEHVSTTSRTSTSTCPETA